MKPPKMFTHLVGKLRKMSTKQKIALAVLLILAIVGLYYYFSESDKKPVSKRQITPPAQRASTVATTTTQGTSLVRDSIPAYVGSSGGGGTTVLRGGGGGGGQSVIVRDQSGGLRVSQDRYTSEDVKASAMIQSLRDQLDALTNGAADFAGNIEIPNELYEGIIDDGPTGDCEELDIPTIEVIRRKNDLQDGLYIITGTQTVSETGSQFYSVITIKDNNIVKPDCFLDNQNKFIDFALQNGSVLGIKVPNDILSFFRILAENDLQFNFDIKTVRSEKGLEDAFVFTFDMNILEFIEEYIILIYMSRYIEKKTTLKEGMGGGVKDAPSYSLTMIATLIKNLGFIIEDYIPFILNKLNNGIFFNTFEDSTEIIIIANRDISLNTDYLDANSLYEDIIRPIIDNFRNCHPRKFSLLNTALFAFVNMNIGRNPSHEFSIMLGPFIDDPRNFSLVNADLLYGLAVGLVAFLTRVSAPQRTLNFTYEKKQDLPETTIDIKATIDQELELQCDILTTDLESLVNTFTTAGLDSMNRDLEGTNGNVENMQNMDAAAAGFESVDTASSMSAAAAASGFERAHVQVNSINQNVQVSKIQGDFTPYKVVNKKGSYSANLNSDSDQDKELVWEMNGQLGLGEKKETSKSGDKHDLMSLVFAATVSIYQSTDGDILLGLDNGASLTRFALIKEDDIKISTGNLSIPLEILPAMPITEVYYSQIYNQQLDYQNEISGIIPLGGDGQSSSPFVSIFNNGNENIRVDLLDLVYTIPSNYFLISFFTHILNPNEWMPPEPLIGDNLNFNSDISKIHADFFNKKFDLTIDNKEYELKGLINRNYLLNTLNDAIEAGELTKTVLGVLELAGQNFYRELSAGLNRAGGPVVTLEELNNAEGNLDKMLLSRLMTSGGAAKAEGGAMVEPGDTKSMGYQNWYGYGDDTLQADIIQIYKEASPSADWDILEPLLAQEIDRAGSEGISVKDADGFTLLHHAVANKDTDLVEFLLEKDTERAANITTIKDNKFNLTPVELLLNNVYLYLDDRAYDNDWGFEWDFSSLNLMTIAIEFTELKNAIEGYNESVQVNSTSSCEEFRNDILQETEAFIDMFNKFKDHLNQYADSIQTNFTRDYRVGSRRRRAPLLTWTCSYYNGLYEINDNGLPKGLPENNGSNVGVMPTDVSVGGGMGLMPNVAYVDGELWTYSQQGWDKAGWADGDGQGNPIVDVMNMEAERIPDNVEGNLIADVMAEGYEQAEGQNWPPADRVCNAPNDVGCIIPAPTPSTSTTTTTPEPSRYALTAYFQPTDATGRSYTDTRIDTYAQPVGSIEGGVE